MSREKFIINSTSAIHDLTANAYESLMDGDNAQALIDLNAVISISRELISTFCNE
jgi:hypothetical protein